MNNPIDCKHWRDEGLLGAGACAIGRFKGRPSHGVCRACLGLPPASAAPQRKAFVTIEQQSRADEHRAICADCPQAQGFTRWTVRCNHCGCAGLSLIQGPCPLGKWK